MVNKYSQISPAVNKKMRSSFTKFSEAVCDHVHGLKRINSKHAPVLEISWQPGMS